MDLDSRIPLRIATLGLGLAIVRAVCDRHGGSVAVGDSRLGGMLIEIRLPVEALEV